MRVSESPSLGLRKVLSPSSVVTQIIYITLTKSTVVYQFSEATYVLSLGSLHESLNTLNTHINDISLHGNQLPSPLEASYSRKLPWKRIKHQFSIYNTQKKPWPAFFVLVAMLICMWASLSPYTTTLNYVPCHLIYNRTS